MANKRSQFPNKQKFLIHTLYESVTVHRSRKYSLPFNPWASGVGSRGCSSPPPPWPAKNSMFLDYFEKMVSFTSIFRQKVGSWSPWKILILRWKKVCGRPCLNHLNYMTNLTLLYIANTYHTMPWPCQGQPLPALNNIKYVICTLHKCQTHSKVTNLWKIKF